MKTITGISKLTFGFAVVLLLAWGGCLENGTTHEGQDKSSEEAVDSTQDSETGSSSVFNDCQQDSECESGLSCLKVSLGECPGWSMICTKVCESDADCADLNPVGSVKCFSGCPEDGIPSTCGIDCTAPGIICPSTQPSAGTESTETGDAGTSPTEEGPSTPSADNPAITTESSGCRDQASKPGSNSLNKAETGLDEQLIQWEYDADTQTLILKHSIIGDCCIDLFEGTVTITQEGEPGGEFNHLTINEFTTDMETCNCPCNYAVTHTVTPVAPGNYEITIGDNSISVTLDETEASCPVVDQGLCIEDCQSHRIYVCTNGTYDYSTCQCSAQE